MSHVAPSLARQMPPCRVLCVGSSQYKPRCRSQGSRELQSSPICRAQTLQQPQPSVSTLTPAGQCRGLGSQRQGYTHSSAPAPAPAPAQLKARVSARHHASRDSNPPGIFNSEVLCLLKSQRPKQKRVRNSSRAEILLPCTLR